MSKLDYVTISIVLVCIAAIIFLVIKTSRLMNDSDPGLEPNPVEETLSRQQSLEESTASYSEEQGESRSDDAPQAGTGAIEDPDDDEVLPFDPSGEEPFGDEVRSETTEEARRKTNVAPPKTEKTTASPSGASSSGKTGKYMVVAGSFRYKANAEEMVRNLKKLGYGHADVGYTNNGAYAVAVVDRFDDPNQARALVSTLKETHQIDAIVKTQD